MSTHAKNHTHSKTCTFEVCGYGPTREQLVRGTLLRRLERGEEFLHYKRLEVEAMRRSAPSVLASSPHNAVGQGFPQASAVHPDETRAVGTAMLIDPIPTDPGGSPSFPAGVSEDVAP